MDGKTERLTVEQNAAQSAQNKAARLGSGEHEAKPAREQGATEDDVQAIKHLRPVPDPPNRLELLFREHHEHVFRAAYRITGSASDAEDVLQTVFLRLARREDEPNLEPSPGGYLHRAAVNAALDLVRSRSRIRSVPIEDVAPVLPVDSGSDPETIRAQSETQMMVRQSLGCLGSTAAEMVALKYFEGLGNNEIAQLLGTSQMVVAVTLHRARTRLRKEIGKLLEA
ncbi:MAG TPA: sigma-70 family RNA polymerase sigma factor [Blastocatellia bacterium]|nr:sigma-70 family RNA polymerase sigma factor [Blastocatellia bacterium]